MHDLFVLLLAILCLSMFAVTRPVKMGILIAAGMCIYEYKLPTGFGSTVLILPLCFFLSEYEATFKALIKYRKTIFLWVLVIGCLFIMYAIIISPHLQEGYMTTITYFLRNTASRYFLPLVALICIRKVKDLKVVFNITFYSFLFVTLFGVANLLLGHSHYVDWLFEGKQLVDFLEDAGSMYAGKERFRISATFHNPFDYGYVCILTMLMFWYGYLKKNVTIERLYMVVTCALFGIVFCNCRTVLLVSMLAVLSFVFIYNKELSYLKYYTMFCIFAVLAFYFVPVLNESLARMLTMFDMNSTGVGGSSLQVRLAQLTAVMGFINGHELFGRGVGFFLYDIGFVEGESGVGGTDLAGLEGSYLSTLLETGIIGTLFYYTIILSVIYWAWSKRNIMHLEASFLFSLFCLFLLFGLMTGELRSAYLTFLVAGIPIKALFNKESRSIFHRKF